LVSKPQITSYLRSLFFTLGVARSVHANMAAATDRYGKAVAVNTLPCEQVISQAEADTMLNGMTGATTYGTTAGQASADNWTRSCSTCSRTRPTP
jgi:hypothetical protein